MKMTRLSILTISALLFCSLATHGEVQPEIKPNSTPKRVLFVGNSFSYYNNGIQNRVSNLIKSAGKWQGGQNRYRLKAISGGKLAEHIAGVPPLLQNSAGKQWDMMVLQEYSNGPISKKYRQSFIDSSASLAKLARKHGIEPVMFMTWAYKNDPDMTQELASAYVTQANKLKALVVPVGLAFARASQDFPQIELYVADISGFNDQGEEQYADVLKHPSVAGTYLAACMFYASFYQQSPQGLPYQAGLDSDVALALQKTAWQTYLQFYQP